MPPELPDTAQPPRPVVPAVPSGPVCAACASEAVVHWQRRPTDDELAELVAAEQSRREQVLRLADPQLPKPEFGPLPTGDGMTRTVYSCGPHAITMDAAALTHQSSCTAPNDADLPGCDCTPEALPEAGPDPIEETAASRLPAHWVTGGE
ncbi:MAG: hypothetical protein HOY76_21505 [Streptomyces sp.]|nr:hypothetical protein [Streptomyces sp.]